MLVVRFQDPQPPPRSQVALQRNRVWARIWAVCAVPSSSLRSDLQPVVFTWMDRLVAETGLGQGPIVLAVCLSRVCC